MKFIKAPGKDFEMGIHQVTQSIFKQVMGSDPSYFKGEQLPVESVSFDEVQKFIAILNRNDEYVYRLPTEEEWEYCCRAGSTTDFCFGDSEEELKDYAWFYKNSDNKTHPVGQKKPNAFGLYDMHGNVWEWIDSLWSPSSSDRVLRGGSWGSYAQSLRSAYRYNYSPGYSSSSVGFRLVREALPSEDKPSNSNLSYPLTKICTQNNTQENLQNANTQNSNHVNDGIKQRMWKAYRTKARREFLKLWKDIGK